MKILVTGGAGFIGSNLVHQLINTTNHTVINVDALTYAGNHASVKELESNSRYIFEKADICDSFTIHSIFEKYQPNAVMHLAAESHVDRSIDGPAAFIHTNIVGTFTLLETARGYYKKLDSEQKNKFRFLHVSTDEVFGALGDNGYFDEKTPYRPNSPYSASKAASDHLARSWHKTYELPLLVTNCSNNYGPYQFPEKLIPVVILNAIEEKTIPVYGAGKNIRDWLYVQDHAQALITVLEKGTLGETYTIGGDCEKRNIELVEAILKILDHLRPRSNGKSYSELITFVQDRPGHDYRYAMKAEKIKNELGWKPQETFESGLLKTIKWYLDNPTWIQTVRQKHDFSQRLGHS